MRVAIGAIIQETSHFTPALCTLDQFRASYLRYGAEIPATLSGTRTEIAGFLDAAAAAGVEVVPTVAAHSVSYGPLSWETFAHLRDELIDRLRAAGPLDGILLAMHGAMAAQGEDDPEGAVIGAIRTALGDVPLAVTLDLHAHITARMVTGADILVGYSHYPHDDTYETAQRAASLLFRTVRGEVRPRMVMTKAPMLIAANNQQTSYGPFARIMERARALEQDSTALSVSCFAVQAWLDLPDMGFAAVVVADGDAGAAAAVQAAADLARLAWSLREEFQVEIVPPRDAIARALATPGGPVVLCDTADAPGGGATGDGTAMLEALLAADLKETSLVQVVDPEAVEQCLAAGLGAQVSLRVGNGIDRSRGEPVPVAGTVRVLHDGRFVYKGGLLGGVSGNMGRSALVQVGSVQLLLTSSSTYEWGDEQFSAVGLDPARAKIVVVKNPMNFKFTFGSTMKGWMVLDTPGPVTANLRSLPYRHLTRPVYPLDAVPEPAVRLVVG